MRTQHPLLKRCPQLASMPALIAAAPTNPFGTTSLQPSNVPFQFDPTSTPDTLSTFELIVSQAVGALTIIGSVFFIGYFVMGAFKWITAGGESSKVQKARDQMTQGILGLVMMVAAYGIIGVAGSILGLTILQPGDAIQQMLLQRP